MTSRITCINVVGRNWAIGSRNRQVRPIIDGMKTAGLGKKQDLYSAFKVLVWLVIEKKDYLQRVENGLNKSSCIGERYHLSVHALIEAAVFKYPVIKKFEDRISIDQ